MFPTIDAVPVVRCKNCIYCELRDGYKICDFYTYTSPSVKDDDYCSDGRNSYGKKDDFDD